MPTELHIYGIRNCDTVRAALKWLDDGDGLQDGTELGDTDPVANPDGAAGPLEGTMVL